MPQYRKKPVVIEARQLVGPVEVIADLAEWCGGKADFVSRPGPGRGMTKVPVIVIPTLEGPMTASHKDYIIKGVNGEFYPCKPDIFEKTYDLVDHAAALPYMIVNLQGLPDPEATSRAVVEALHRDYATVSGGK